MLTDDRAHALKGQLNAALKYNPHLWGPDELRAIFVVRGADLEHVLQALHGTMAEAVPQHLLITGHRGMGKSTLLQRLALAIADDPQLSRQWLALTFPEEQYTIHTLAEFWRNVLDALADALERAGADPTDLADLDQQIGCLGQLPLLQREEAALILLQRWIADHGRGLVLLVDSSDQLLNSLAQAESKNTPASATALWRLRKTLSHQAGLFWIGASYQALESQHQYQDAFHDFFQLHELLPLKTVEMRTALLALARRFGAGRGLQGTAAEAEMARILDSRPERLEALRLLSGGNPRTTVTLYELFAAGGDDSVQADLKRLLDIMTPLYKARMESLAEQPRKLLAHLMENWHPMAGQDLAQQAGIAKTTVSGQLSRLESEGLVEKARLAGRGKRSGFQVSERLFNIWYLMRYGSRRIRQRLAWLVQFMRLWFSRDELCGLAHQRAQRHSRGELGDAGNLEYSRALATALGQESDESLNLEWSVFSSAQNERRRLSRELKEILPGLYDLEGEDREFKSADDYLTRFAALDAPLAACPHVPEGEKQAWVDQVKGSILMSLEQKEGLAGASASAELSDELWQTVKEALDKEKNTSGELFSKPVAALIRTATLAGQFFPDCPNSKVAFLQMESCFVTQPPAYKAALALFQAKHQDEWLYRAFCRATELNPHDWPLWVAFGNLLESHLRRFNEAEAAYRKAIAADNMQSAPWLQLGILLNHPLQRYNEAEAAFRQAIALDENAAIPWLALGILLGAHLGRHVEAEAAHRQAISLDERSAFPWVGLGTLFHQRLQRYDEAEAAYRQAIALDETYALPWNNLGDLFAKNLQRYDEAETAYLHAVTLAPSDAFIWSKLAQLQARQQKTQEANDSFRQVLQCLASPQGKDDTHLALQAQLWLGNRAAAAQALTDLAQLAAADDKQAFSNLRQQCLQCSALGLGPALADLMTENAWADFLQPFSLALNAARAGEAPAGAAPEVLSLAQEILTELT